jgi:putative PEP-CTERM system integral membrane protein
MLLCQGAIIKVSSYNKILRIANYTTFWGWNLTFLLLTIFGIMPWVGLAVTTAVLSGELSLDFLISMWLLVLVPTISVWIARKRFRGQPNLQIRLFYGVEAPIFLLCLVRLFAIRELTWGSAFLMGSIFLAAFIYGRHLLQSVKATASENKFTLPLNSLLLIIALYVGVLLSFYALPAGWSVIEFIFKFEWLKVIFEFITTPKLWLPLLLGMLWWIPFGFLFIFFSVALFIFSPIALVRFYGQAWLQTWKREAEKSSPKIALGITGSVIALWLMIFVLVDRQPQIETFEILAQPAATQDQKKNIVNHADDIRQGLLNAYLYPYRYLSAKTDVNHIETLYEHVFALPKSATKPLQNLYNALLSPVLYKGERNDDTKAADLYASIFDTPIQKGEKEAITDALEATADRDQAEAGLLNINQLKVWLAEQQITTTQSDSVTKVELYEVYENTTPQRQEIFYYFSLPENATVTGLWLGESPDKDKRQAYAVSPRGAAQKVYKEQVRERVDPALLEQVGPRQYRLRAFPIPPSQLPPHINRFLSRGISTQQPLQEQPKMHLWLTYSVLNDRKHSIFPDLLEKRNVYWTEKTKRSVNGSTFSKATAWMPDNAKNLQPAVGTLEVPMKEEGYIISARPTSSEILKHAEKEKIAILIDTSYSMRLKKKEIVDSVDWLQKQNPSISADVFVSPIREQLKKITASAQDVSQITFFGFLSDSDLWNQASSLQEPESYDAVFVISDQGSYELAHDKTTLMDGKSPVWFVHLGQLAPAYEDNVMYKLLLSHGGVATKFDEAYQQFLMQRSVASTQRIHGETLWDFVEQPAIIEGQIAGENDPIAAKMLIDYLASKQPTTTLETLDAIHQIAKKQSVVTPYSSMIVLVNDQQKEQLKKAEQEKDRFDRVVDKGVENLTKPGNAMVSAVPEPETWILLILSLFFLYFLVKRQRHRSITTY